MNKLKQTIIVTILAFSLHACGGVHHKVVTQPQSTLILEQIKLLPVKVNSKEQNPDALSLNDQWKELVSSELQTILDAKRILITGDSNTTLECRIDVVYGNQALRYFVGFGAGSGHVSMSLKMKDKFGAVLYATNTEADLSIGVFGGSMQQLVRKTINDALKEFDEQV